MPNGAGKSDPFDFRSGDIQSKGMVWFSRDMQTMLGFAEVRLDGPATKEILKQTQRAGASGTRSLGAGLLANHSCQTIGSRLGV